MLITMKLVEVQLQANYATCELFHHEFVGLSQTYFLKLFFMLVTMILDLEFPASYSHLANLTT